MNAQGYCSRIVRASVVGGALTLAVTQAEAICIPGARLAGDDVAYLYVGAYIDSLGYADQARQKMSNGLGSFQKRPTTQSDFYASTVDALAGLEFAAKDFECSASIIALQKNLPIDQTNSLAKDVTETAQLSAGLIELEYRQLATLMREYSGIMQAGLNGTLPDSERAGKVALLVTKMQESWGSIVVGVNPTELLLVDPEADPKGHLSRLRITEQQRDDLVKSIDQRFGNRVRRKASENTPSVEVAAILLREFLTNKGYTLKKAK